MTLLRLGATLGAICMTTTSLAATRTVCFSITFEEGRVGNANSPVEGEVGAKRGRHTSDPTTPAFGHVYELWDKDSSGSDEFIGSFVRAVDGRACATFEWENSSASKGEANPDVYVKYVNRVRATTLDGDSVKAVDENKDPYPKISWRNGKSGNPDAFVAVNCAHGTTCDILPTTRALAITTNITSLRAQRVNALDTAQRALQTFGPEFNYTSDNVVEMVFPCVSGTTPGTSCPGIASAANREEFYINGSAAALNGRSSAHELGHQMQMGQFDRDSLSFSYSLNGPNWARTVPETEAAAVMEGWADFTAAVSWWDDNDSGSLPRVAGLSLEAATPVDSTSCANNSGIPIQSAKGFWDLVDANNEAGAAPASAADNFNTTPAIAAAGWSRFGRGTANRQDRESDDDGPNLRDYFWNNRPFAPFSGTGFFVTLMNHNCTGSQDNG